MRKYIFLVWCVLCPFILKAQLRPGFDKEEYIEMLSLASRQGDSSWWKGIPEPKYFQRIYRSEETGLKNRWDLWRSNEEKVIVVSIRGTTADGDSWLENFYSGMVPATGVLSISDTEEFSYKLADDKRAYVHAGWLIGMCHLAKDILPRIDSCYKEGVRDLVITGHSQGGALSYLLTAYLLHSRKDGKLPADLAIKTYCSAAPKPGNLYFANDYDYLTREGWAFNVINTADWVPETPMTVQTLEDFNTTNPFKDIDGALGNQNGLTKLILRRVYNKMKSGVENARDQFVEYLGERAGLEVKKKLPYYKRSVYENSFHYVRAGRIITLLPDEEYFKKWPDDSGMVFTHHLLQPYLFLVKKY